jgi:hypothetical protein
MGLFNSTILDVIIGLIFVYLLLSILCTAANEWVAALTKRRANTMQRGITQLLAGQHLTDENTLINAFYRPRSIFSCRGLSARRSR